MAMTFALDLPRMFPPRMVLTRSVRTADGVNGVVRRARPLPNGVIDCQRLPS